MLMWGRPPFQAQNAACPVGCSCTERRVCIRGRGHRGTVSLEEYTRRWRRAVDAAGRGAWLLLMCWNILPDLYAFSFPRPPPE